MSQKLDRRSALACMVGAFLCPNAFTAPVDRYILPERGELQIYEDNTPRPRRSPLVIRTEMGFAVLDNRRILLAEL